MFTGLVEQMGRVLAAEPRPAGIRLRLTHQFEGLSLGESISVSGACLTVVEFDASSFAVDISLETKRLTTLGQLQRGASVNLERAAKVGDRLGGHLVSGHVDGVGMVHRLQPDADMTAMTISVGSQLARFCATKGSITIEGVSLTTNLVSDDAVDLMLIPHTLAVTTLGQLQLGSPVNVEVDQVARYVERLLQRPGPNV